MFIRIRKGKKEMEEADLEIGDPRGKQREADLEIGGPRGKQREADLEIGGPRAFGPRGGRFGRGSIGIGLFGTKSIFWWQKPTLSRIR